MEEKFETVISGISGRFPDCESIPEFQTKLYSGKSFMSLVPTRWPINYRYQYTDIVLPSATGKFKLIKEFDPAVFKMNRITAECTDVINRKILEPSFEAIMDSGLSPYDLSGRNVGVFMSYDHSDSDANSVHCNGEGRLWVMGSSKTMMSNRVSFALNLTGPSFTYANDMFGNLTALSEAFKSVSEGRVEAAIVGIVTAVQHPTLGVNLSKMNILSPDSVTRVFDKNANGYGRSDSLVALFIQRADDAKRIYASIDFSECTYFGSNPNSFFDFDENLLKNSMAELYRQGNYNHDIDDITFVEMSACGLPKYDKTESNFIADTFCKSRKNPLLVGSVKSNVGMTDSSGPYVSLIKAIFALESGVIVQNLNFDQINDQIEAFVEKKLQVVTKPTPLLSDKIVVNAVGMVGALSQVVLKRNTRKKKIVESSSSDDLPRLIFACARTEDGIENVLRKLEQTSFNFEFISMVNDVFSKDMPFHIFRGYSILSNDVNVQKTSSFDVKGNKNRPVWFLFSGMGSQWNKMGEGLLKFPIIAETVKKCDQVLKNVGVDIYRILTTNDPTVFDNIMHSFVGIITIQIALVEVLKALGIKPDGIIGHSVGENACAYADGCLTLEQAVLASYARGMASIETKTIKGMMAAVGKGYQEIKYVLPESIEVACHNSANSCTLSGPTEDVEEYVEQLQQQKIFAKAVNVANIAYHSKHIAPAAPNLLARLQKVIPKPVKRSSMWISTSVPESEWDKPLAQYCSAEYLTNNLLNSVLFEEGSKHIPADALVIEIAPHGLLQAIMKRSLPKTCANVALTRRNNEGKNLENLLSAVGQLFICGIDVNVNALYPPIEYPVSRETPSISQFARWHHTAPDAGVFYFDLVGSHSGDPITIHINDDSPYYYLRDHQINNRVILPTSFFLYLAWWVVSVIQNQKLDSQNVIFEDIKLSKNLSISLTKSQKVAVFIQKGSGKFEILKYTDADWKTKPVEIMSGILYQPHESFKHVVDESNLRNVKYTISSDQFYGMFKDVGYQLENTFRSLEELKYNKNDCFAKIKWNNNWVCFLDSLLKFHMFGHIKNKTDLLYTHRIRKLEISAEEISSLENGTTLLCHKEIRTNLITCKGIKIFSIVNKRFPSSKQNKLVKFEGLRFVSHENPRCQNVSEFLKLCLNIAIDNLGIMSKKNQSDAKLNVITDNNANCSRLLNNIVKDCDSLKTKIVFHESKRVVFRNDVMTKECCMLVKDDFPNVGKSVFDCSFLLFAVYDGESAPLAKLDDVFILITKQRFGDRIFYLFKKKSLSVDKVEDRNWSEHYFKKKNNESKHAHIVKKNIDTADLSTMLSESRNPSDSRYLFVMDDEIPPNSSLKRQQMQDLPVAVLQNGEWGSYRSLSGIMPQSEENSELSNGFTEDIRLESIHLQYLCPDKHDEFQDDEISNYGIEYSGITYTGERVMGLSLVNSCEPVSKPDPILKWNVPKDWSFEDAATVPFIYSQAYRILGDLIINGEKYVNSILINFGDEGAFCEACISISLSRNHTVYVTVSNNQGASLIKSKFPQLDDKQILNLRECALQAEILNQTKGLGVDMVVNCSLDIEVIKDSLNCSSNFCNFVQIGKLKNWETESLELYPFLKSISFITVQNRISSLLKLSKDEKLKLKALVQDGIEAGIVKPIDSHVKIQKTSETNERCEKMHAKNIFKWSPTSEKCEKTNQKIRYDGNRSYIIVGGDKKNTCWFELVEWLISKGARKFITIVDDFVVGPNISHRMNRLLTQKKATIVLSSSQKLETLRDSERVVEEANNIAPLEAVYFASVPSADKKIHNLDLATRQLDSNVHLISIFSGGLKECESRRFCGLPATVIHAQGKTSSRKLASILPQLDDILSQCDNNNSPTLYRFINSEGTNSGSVLSNYLPRDLSTLESMADDLSSNELQFFEVSTKTPRYSALKDCSPIFIVSVLGPRPLRGLLSNLMSPAFCANIGSCTDDLVEVALKLYKSLNNIQSKGGVTLVSETWSSPIAFEMMKLLDRDGRKYRLFTLDGNPLMWKQRVRALGPMDSNQFENNLIGQLFNVDLETRLDNLFGLNKPLENKLSDYLHNRSHTNTSINVFHLIKILRSLRLGLEIIVKYEYDNQLLKNTVFMERNFDENYSLNLSMTSESFVHEEQDYFKFLTSQEVYRKINSDIVYTLWYD